MIDKLAKFFDIGRAAVFSFGWFSLMEQQSQSITYNPELRRFAVFSAGGSDAHVRPPECA